LRGRGDDGDDAIRSTFFSSGWDEEGRLSQRLAINIVVIYYYYCYHYYYHYYYYYYLLSLKGPFDQPVMVGSCHQKHPSSLPLKAALFAIYKNGKCIRMVWSSKNDNNQYYHFYYYHCY